MCILATSQTLMLIKRECMHPHWEKKGEKKDGIKPVYIAAECFPVSCLCSLSISSSHAFRCLPFFSLGLCVSHTRTHAQESNANSRAIVVQVFITSWQPRSSRNGITVSWRWTQTGSNCAVVPGDVDRFWRRSK